MCSECHGLNIPFHKLLWIPLILTFFVLGTTQQSVSLLHQNSWNDFNNNSVEVSSAKFPFVQFVRSESRSSQCDTYGNSLGHSIPTHLLEVKGCAVHGDSLIPSPFPCWFDVRLARIGQKFARANLFQVIYAHFVSLVILLSNDQISTILFATGRSNTPPKSFKRYASTAIQVKLWYDIDILHPLWWRSVRTVRNIHNKIPEDVGNYFDDQAGVLKYGKMFQIFKSYHEEKKFERLRPRWRTVFSMPPLLPNEKLWNAFRLDLQHSNYAFNVTGVGIRGGWGSGWGQSASSGSGSKPRFFFNQFIMTLTQWAFVALPIIRTRSLSIPHWTDLELQGFAHLWAVIGYALGMDEKFILCRNAVEDMNGCKMELEETFHKYFVPGLLNLGFVQKIMMESLLRTITELAPALPSPSRLLMGILGDIFDIPTPHLTRFERRGRAGRMMTDNVFRPLLRSGRIQGVTNFVTSRGLEYASYKSFGDFGKNYTVAGTQLFYLD